MTPFTHFTLQSGKKFRQRSDRLFWRAFLAAKATYVVTDARIAAAGTPRPGAIRRGVGNSSIDPVIKEILPTTAGTKYTSQIASRAKSTAALISSSIPAPAGELRQSENRLVMISATPANPGITRPGRRHSNSIARIPRTSSRKAVFGPTK